MTRGRPRKEDPETALNAAMMLFWQKGFKRTTLSDLEQATGLVKPSLYHAFGNKMEIFAKALEHYVETVGRPISRETLRDDIPVDQGIRNFLTTVADRTYDNSTPEGCMTVNTIVESSDSAPELKKLSRKFSQERFNYFRHYLERVEANGLLPDGFDVDSLTSFLEAQFISISVLYKSGIDRENVQRSIDTAIKSLKN